MLRVVLLTVGLGFLAACASLSETECRGGDWFSIGVEDGSDGRLTSFFERHVKACSKHGIAPVRADWLEGRQRGLQTYCTPENAYQIGRSGRRVAPVCTPRQEAEMLGPNQVGLTWYQIGREITELENELSNVRSDLREADPDDPLYILLLRDERQIRRDIRRLERERLRVGIWP